MPAFPTTGGVIRICQFGFYTNAGGSALTVTIAEPELWEDGPIAFVYKNRGTANITITPASPRLFYVNGATAANFIVKPNTSVYVIWDGAYFYPVFAESVNIVQRFTPSTGATLTIVQTGSPIINIVIVPAGTIAALTIPFPATPFDGQIVTISSRQIITAVTQTIGTVSGGITTLAANGFASFVYCASDTTWQRNG